MRFLVVVRKIFPRRDAPEHLKRSDSAHRRQLAGQLTSSAGENNESHQTCGIPAIRRRAALLPARVAVREKEVRAQLISLDVLHAEEQLRRLSKTRHGQRAVRKSQREKLRRPGRNNFVGFESRLREKFPQPRLLRTTKRARFSGACAKDRIVGRRLTQAPLQQLRDLHRVQSCAFEQLVAGHPKAESIFKGAIKTDPDNLTIILAGYTQWHRIAILLRLVHEL